MSYKPTPGERNWSQVISALDQHCDGWLIEDIQLQPGDAASRAIAKMRQALADMTTRAIKAENDLLRANNTLRDRPVRYENIEGVVFDMAPNTINMQGYDGEGKAVAMSTRSSFDVSRDAGIVDLALLFNNAARRGVAINAYPVANLLITTVPVNTPVSNNPQPL